MITYDITDPASSNTIPGPHEEPVVQSPKMNKKINHFWGLMGNSILVSHPGARQITIDMWLNYWTWTNVEDLLAGIDWIDQALIGEPATLTVQNDVDQYWPVSHKQVFTNIVLDGYRLLPLRGQSNPAPILDSAATIYHKGPHAGAKTWLIRMQLMFTQAVADRNLT